MKLLVNFLVSLLFLTAIICALWAKLYFVTLILLVVAALYWFLDRPSAPGTVLFVTQNGFAFSLFGLLMIGIGLHFAYLGISEFSKPIIITGRSYLLGNLITAVRGILGSIGVSLVLWCISGFGFLYGIRTFRLGIKKLKTRRV